MKLTNENISEIISQTENILNEKKVADKNKVKICLLLEEALVRYKEKYGEDTEFRFIEKKWFFSREIVIRIRGEAYNPLEEKSEEEIFLNSLMGNLMQYEGADVNYRYKNGFNEICATYAKERKNFKIPGGKTTIAVLLAFVCSFLLQFFPVETQKAVTEEMITPILNTLFHAIIAVNIPLVFINIVASICSIDDASSLNNLAMKIIVSFAKIMLTCLIVSLLIANFFFPTISLGFESGAAVSTMQNETSILHLLLSMVPQNIIEPFSKGNIMQIVCLAIVIGCCVTVLGNRVNMIKEFISESKIIIFKMVSLVLKIMPLIVFLSILKALHTDFGSNMFDVWKILVAIYLSYIVIVGTMLLKNYVKYNTNPIDFLKKIYPPCLITFTTSSGSAALPKNLEVCKNELNVNETLCNLYIPLSHVLCPISRLIIMSSYIIFTACFFGVNYSIIQMAIIAFLVTQFALSAANEAGGIIACMALFLTQLGFSLDVMSILMISDIFLSNFYGVASLIVRDSDLYNLSRSYKTE